MPENVNITALASGQLGIDEEEDNRPVMIDVEHVSMSFNMASEQLNNLKEYAIAIARGKLFFEEFKALDDVSFQVRKGDVFGIMGTNGSGKSTILKIIAGVLEPTKGKCSVNGNIAPLIELGAGFDMDLSARENIYLNGALLGYSKDFINEHFDEIVEFAEVEKFLDMPLKNYSSGMVSRIAFAIATVIVPEILVVDEVLSVGDFMFQKKCENRITQLIEEHGVTVLIVSHSNEQIARLCNKAIWIEKGHTRLIGDAQDVARIYGGLGGRTGSKESESTVFQALSNCVNTNADELLNECTTISGESAAAVCCHMLDDAWAEETIDNLVIAASNTHVNALVANGLAGCMKSPVLNSGGIELLHDSVERVLYRYRPSHIVFVDISGAGRDVVRRIEQLDWSPRVDWIHGEPDAAGNVDLLDFSLQVYSYGQALKVWSASALCVDFDSNPKAFALAPLSYQAHMPILVVRKGAVGDRFIAKLSNSGISAIYCLGEGLKDELRTKLSGSSVQLDDICDDLSTSSLGVTTSNKWGLSHDGACFGADSILQWPEFVAIGAYCSARNLELLLLSQSDLDSVSYCIRYLQNNHIARDEIVFIGDKNGLNRNEQQLLLSSCVCQ